MNNLSDSYAAYFQLMKTSKNIADIKEKISDRLIVTKDGKLYFDYSDNERIEISNRLEQYKTNVEFTNVNDVVTYAFDGINVDIKTINDEIIDYPVLNTLVFDKYGNLGMITDIDMENGTVNVHILTKNLTSEQIMNLVTIKRYIY